MPNGTAEQRGATAPVDCYVYLSITRPQALSRTRSGSRVTRILFLLCHSGHPRLSEKENDSAATPADLPGKTFSLLFSEISLFILEIAPVTIVFLDTPYPITTTSSNPKYSSSRDTS